MIQIKKTKYKLCLIIDVRNWAFHHIALQIRKRYPSDIFTYNDFSRSVLNKSFEFQKYINYVFFFLPLKKTNFKKKIKEFNRINRIFFLLYENYTWTLGEKYKIGFIQKLIGVNKLFVASPKILENLKKTLPGINIHGTCYDGVNEKIFKYKSYDENILTKDKLVIGWIGNSDLSINGKVKRFKEIKEVVDGLPDKFVFKPLDSMKEYIPHNQVPNYIYSVDIIVCFSTSEGTPNQILEASSCGRCWVSTDVGIVSMLQNTISNNNCGIIIGKEKEDLKEALLELYDNRELITKYGTNGRIAIQKKFRIDLTINNIISQVLKR
tara:strand:+ start:5125 stop:6093 length:969 start_codon:yes stop_codon:yes gene_type:complete